MSNSSSMFRAEQQHFYQHLDLDFRSAPFSYLKSAPGVSLSRWNRVVGSEWQGPASIVSCCKTTLVAGEVITTERPAEIVPSHGLPVLKIICMLVGCCTIDNCRSTFRHTSWSQLEVSCVSCANCRHDFDEGKSAYCGVILVL